MSPSHSCGPDQYPSVVVVSGTGAYANLDGQGLRAATIDLNTGIVTDADGRRSFRLSEGRGLCVRSGSAA
jgi:hypothetical protein